MTVRGETMRETTVLVVDDDDDSRAETAELFRGELQAATVLTAASVGGAQEHLEREPVDVVVTSYALGDGNGLELTEYVRSLRQGTGSILYANRTAVDTEEFEETIVEFVQKGTADARDNLVGLVEQAGTEQSQAAYPLPGDEAGRLTAVETYVGDSAAVAAPLDRITTLAARHFGVEVASINIITRRTQEFLATTGPRWPPGSREDSICTHTIVHDETTMAIEDVREDPRFADNETLDRAGLVSYLGAKLVTPAGRALGSLCVYDDEPRQFSPDERAYLETLAALVVDVLVLHEQSKTDENDTDEETHSQEGGAE
jgi:GAF domain-containing protein